MLDRKSQHHIRGNELDSQFIQQGLQFIVCVSEGGPLTRIRSHGYPLHIRRFRGFHMGCMLTYQKGTMLQVKQVQFVTSSLIPNGTFTIHLASFDLKEAFSALPPKQTEDQQQSNYTCSSGVNVEITVPVTCIVSC